MLESIMHMKLKISFKTSTMSFTFFQNLEDKIKSCIISAAKAQQLVPIFAIPYWQSTAEVVISPATIALDDETCSKSCVFGSKKLQLFFLGRKFL